MELPEGWSFDDSETGWAGNISQYPFGPTVQQKPSGKWAVWRPVLHDPPQLHRRRERGPDGEKTYYDTMEEAMAAAVIPIVESDR